MVERVVIFVMGLVVMAPAMVRFSCSALWETFSSNFVVVLCIFFLFAFVVQAKAGAMQWFGVKRMKRPKAPKTIGFQVKVNSMVVFKRKETLVTIVIVGSVTNTIPNLVTLRPQTGRDVSVRAHLDAITRCEKEWLYQNWSMDYQIVTTLSMSPTLGVGQQICTAMQMLVNSFPLL